MRVIRAIETHCGGPHCRVLFAPFDIPGESMFEKAAYLQQHDDRLRRLLLREPRASPTTNVDLIVPSPDPRADFGVIIMEQSHYSPMSGGNLMSVVTAVLETGVLQMAEPVTRLAVDTPAGLVRAAATCSNGRVRSVAIANAPAFASVLDKVIEVPGIGSLTVDVAYGGMFYVLAEAAAAGLEIDVDQAADLVRVGEAVKQAARHQITATHPANDAIDRIESVLWWGPPVGADNHGRNTVVISLESGTDSVHRGVLDRCPCGTGTCARLAVLHAKGELTEGQEYRHEGILDSVFTGRVLETLKVNGIRAIRPEVTGSAWITGFTEHILHDDDPFPEGFLLPDL